jgi:hypothetical protein
VDLLAQHNGLETNMVTIALMITAKMLTIIRANCEMGRLLQSAQDNFFLPFAFGENILSNAYRRQSKRPRRNQDNRSHNLYSQPKTNR